MPDHARKHHYERLKLDRVISHDLEHMAPVEVGAAPATRILSFTVTKAGDCLAGVSSPRQ